MGEDLRHTDKRGHGSPNEICSENSDHYRGPVNEKAPNKNDLL